MKNNANLADVVLNINSFTSIDKMQSIITMNKIDVFLWSAARGYATLADITSKINLKALEESQNVNAVKNNYSPLRNSFRDRNVSLMYVDSGYDGVAATLDSNNIPTCIPANTSITTKTTDYDMIIPNAYEKALADLSSIDSRKYCQRVFLKNRFNEGVY